MSQLIDPKKKARVEEIEALMLALDEERSTLLREIGLAISGPVSDEAKRWASETIKEMGLDDPERRAAIKTRPFSEFRAEAIARGFGPKGAGATTETP